MACSFDALFAREHRIQNRDTNTVRDKENEEFPETKDETEEEDEHGETEDDDGEEKERHRQHRQLTVRRFSTAIGGKRIIESSPERRVVDPECSQHRVLVLGSSQVGKTSLMHQFPSLTPQPYAATQDRDQIRSVCEVELDGWRSQVEFYDPSTLLWIGLVHGDTEAVKKLEELRSTVLIIVFAVDSNMSLSHAAHMLSFMKRGVHLERRSAILVGNKTDLVRNREMTTVQGSDLAARYGLSYLEVSSGLGYNIDTLLVMICQEIQKAGMQVQPVKKQSIKEKMFGLVTKKFSV